MPNSIFVTGATGYVGRRLLPSLYGDAARRVCLVRQSDLLEGDPVFTAQDVQLVDGDLNDAGSYLDALASCDLVVHLAAVTGKAPPREYDYVNAQGTQELVDACRQVGVSQFILFSTIAAKFRNQQRYFYAHSKKRAEEIVAGSGMSYTIVRPTMIFGPNSPVLNGLCRLGGANRAIVFGNGRVSVQPIFVDDLIRIVQNILSEAWYANDTIECGGADVLTIEDLLNRIRATRFRKPPRSLHLPLRPIRGVLGILERFLLPYLPLSAGQLASFANDGTSVPHPWIAKHIDELSGIDKMLEVSLRDV